MDTVVMPTSEQIEAFRASLTQSFTRYGLPDASWVTRGMALDAIEAATTPEAWTSAPVAQEAAMGVIDRDWELLGADDQRWFRGAVDGAIVAALLTR